ncbi:MAG: cyclic nucleotide-binding domain-containing protein [Spirochaetaceae bacterium]|jgi:CRP-like cAMP-binding protein|nr:cyclic nucleotide-binding domain-containing protein [Spirochaetaceae bacterium]
MPDKPLLSFASFKKDSFVILEGKQNADRFYIIKQGQVLLSKEVELIKEDNLLREGDFFGVVSSMSGHSHIETARAHTDVVLIAVAKDQYTQLIRNNASIAMKIIQQFSKRMRYMDEILTARILKNAVQDPSTQIYDVAEYYIRQGQYNIAFYAYHKYIKNNPSGENVASAREKMLKLAPRVKNVKLEHNTAEFNRIYAKDTMIFSEGENGQELYIIQKGAVKIVKIVQNQEVLLAVLHTGDIFGEMALLESKPRAACAIAFEDTTLMTVSRQNFEDMVVSRPQLVARLTALLADRIWFSYKQLANARIADPLGRLYDQLLIQLEKNEVPLGNHASYVFDFGPKELVNMVGISRQDGISLVKKMTTNGRILIAGERIHVSDITEIVKQAEFYHKMEKIGHSRA